MSDISAMQINTTSLQLQFQPSYALHETVSVDYYIIEVTGVENEYNITSTVIELSLTDYCSHYNVSITPYNSVGAGEKSHENNIAMYKGIA